MLDKPKIFMIAGYIFVALSLGTALWNIAYVAGKSDGIIEHACWQKQGVIVSGQCLMEAK